MGEVTRVSPYCSVGYQGMFLSQQKMSDHFIGAGGGVTVQPKSAPVSLTMAVEMSSGLRQPDPAESNYQSGVMYSVGANFIPQYHVIRGNNVGFYIGPALSGGYTKTYAGEDMTFHEVDVRTGRGGSNRVQTQTRVDKEFTQDLGYAQTAAALTLASPKNGLGVQIDAGAQFLSNGDTGLVVKGALVLFGL